MSDVNKNYIPGPSDMIPLERADSGKRESVTVGNLVSTALKESLTPTKHTVAVLGDSRAAQCGSAVTPASITSLGTTITVNATGHGLHIGQPLTVGGCNEVAYNGVFTVTNVVDANNFQYTAKSIPSAGTATGAPSYTNPEAMKNTGFFTWINAVMGARFQLILNAGVSGDTVADYSQRVVDVINANPDYCFDVGIFNSLGSQSSVEIIAVLERIYAALVDAGISVITLTESPYHSSAAGYTAEKNEIILEVNNWKRGYSRNHNGVLVLDAYKVIVDPTSATGQPKADMHWSSDFIHWTPKACFAIANECNILLGNIVPPGNTLAVSVLDKYDATLRPDNKNVLENGLMIGSSGSLVGGTTGTVADDWAMDKQSAATVAASVVPRADGFGNDQQIIVTSSGVAACRLYTTTPLHSRVVPGDRVYLEAEIDISSATNFDGIWARAAMISGGITSSIAAMIPQQDGQSDQSDMTLTLRSLPFVIPPAGVTNLSAWFHFYFSGAGGVTAKVGRAVLIKV